LIMDVIVNAIEEGMAERKMDRDKNVSDDQSIVDPNDILEDEAEDLLEDEGISANKPDEDES